MTGFVHIPTGNIMVQAVTVQLHEPSQELPQQVHRACEEAASITDPEAYVGHVARQLLRKQKDNLRVVITDIPGARLRITPEQIIKDDIVGAGWLARQEATHDLETWLQWFDGPGVFLVMPLDCSVTEIVYETNVRANCSIGKAPFTGRLTVSYMPNERFIEFQAFDRMLEQICERDTIIEQLVSDVFARLWSGLQPDELEVKLEATTEVHGPATVRRKEVNRELQRSLVD